MTDRSVKIMPKNAFDLIAPQKRELLLRSAARLFSENGFSRTDMAQIAGTAGIAKGSLYNYFVSKEELYLFVCRDGMERSRRAVYGAISPEWDVYRQIEHIFRQGSSFAEQHPEYVRLYLNLSSAGMERFAGSLSREVETFTSNHLKMVIARDRETGLVRKDVDVNMAAFLINSLYIMFVVSLVAPQFRERMRIYLDREEAADGGGREAVNGVIEAVFAMLRPQVPESGAGQGSTHKEGKNV